MRFTRKIRYIIDSKIPNYYYKRYPYLVQFIYAIMNFFDKIFGKEVLNFTRNLDVDRIYDRFLDSYYRQTANEIISIKKYQLTNKIKRLFISLSNFFYTNKGKKLSFDIALSYLSQFYNYNEDNYVENIDYTLEENVNNWYSIDTIDPQRPYTYTLNVGDAPKALISDMINNLNPVGFAAEYLYEQHIIEPDSVDLLDIVYSEEIMTVQYNQTPFQYNGVHKYDGEWKYNGIWYDPASAEYLNN